MATRPWLPTTKRQGRTIDRHVPERSCIGCRTRRPWDAVVRLTFARAPDGRSTVVVDGASSGRGAWLCRTPQGGVDEACREAAIAKNQFARAWRSAVTQDDVAAIRDAT